MEFQLHHHGDVVIEYGLIGAPGGSVAIALHGFSRTLDDMVACLLYTSPSPRDS